MRRRTVLVVDDDPSILSFVRMELELFRFRVITTTEPTEVLNLIETEHPDIVLLDIRFPNADGLELLRQVRSESAVPIILLTAVSTDRHKVRGLNLGADDYLTKPFNPDELIARISAVLRRARPSPEHTSLHIGDLAIDSASRTVQVAGRTVDLSPTEWELLYHLASNAGRVMLHGQLLRELWGPAYGNDLQYLRVWVSRLRKKLGDNPTNPRYIRTVPGVGYALIADGPNASEPEHPSQSDPIPFASTSGD
ncbi:MAG TPA: response regulator transcription factor [Chloroflexota bacterium]